MKQKSFLFIGGLMVSLFATSFIKTTMVEAQIVQKENQENIKSKIQLLINYKNSAEKAYCKELYTEVITDISQCWVVLDPKLKEEVYKLFYVLEDKNCVQFFDKMFPVTPDIYEKIKGQIASKAIDPTILNKHIISNNGHFEIWFNETDPIHGTTLPYVNRLAILLEDAWNAETVGYVTPSMWDLNNPGLTVTGIPVIVLVGDCPEKYGSNIGYAIHPTNNTIRSKIEVDNDFANAEINTFFGALSIDQRVKAVTAHEFYHVLQYNLAYSKGWFPPSDRNYVNFEKLTKWWQEATAVWMEDQVYDDETDNFYTRHFDKVFRLSI